MKEDVAIWLNIISKNISPFYF